MKSKQGKAARTQMPQRQVAKAPARTRSPIFSAPDTDFLDVDLELASAMGNQAMLDAIAQKTSRAATPPPVDNPDDGTGRHQARQNATLPFRGEMEQGFGRSFGHVQIITGEDVEEAGEALGAEAFTSGDQIAFANDTPSKELVAHELAHVAQTQGPDRGETQGHAASSKPGQAAEREADQASSAVAGGGHYQVQEQPGGDIQGSWLSSFSDALASMGGTVASTVDNVVDAFSGDEAGGGDDTASTATVAEQAPTEDTSVNTDPSTPAAGAGTPNVVASAPSTTAATGTTESSGAEEAVYNEVETAVEETSWFSGFVGSAVDTIQSAGSTIADGVAEAGEAMVGTAEETETEVQAQVEEQETALAQSEDQSGGWLNVAKGFFSSTVETATSVTQQVVQGASEAVSSAVSAAGSLGTGVAQSATGFISSAWETVTDVGSSLLDSAGSIASDLSQQASDLVGTVTQAAQGIVSSVSETAGPIFNYLTDKVATIGSTVSKVYNGLGLNVGRNVMEWLRPDTTQYGQEFAEGYDGPTVIFASGIMTDAEKAGLGAEALAEHLGVPVTAVANPTYGFFADMLESAAEKYLGIDSIPSSTITDQIVQNLLNDQGVMIYAHSQGSINTASAIRQAEDALTLYYEQQGVDDPKALAQQAISNNVTVQPIGGAANLDDNSMTYEQPQIENPLDVITEYFSGMWRMTGGVVEAAVGDYPTWYTGVKTPIADSADLVPALLTQDVEFEKGEESWWDVFTFSPHGIGSYVDNQGDALQNSYDDAQAAMSVSASTSQLLADTDRDTPETEQAEAAFDAALASGDGQMMALMTALFQEPKGTALLFLEEFANSDLEPFIEPFDVTSTALGFIPWGPAQTMSTGLGLAADGMTTYVGLVTGNEDKVLDGATGLALTGLESKIPGDLVDLDVGSLDSWIENGILQTATGLIEEGAQVVVDELSS